MPAKVTLGMRQREYPLRKSVVTLREFCRLRMLPPPRSRRVKVPDMWSLLPIAMRNVARNKRRTAITLAALLIGVSVMVSMRGLINGLQRSMIENVALGQTGALQIHRKGYMKNVLGSPLNLDLPADDAFMARIAKVPGVVAVAPRIIYGGMVNLGDVTMFMATIAIDPKREFATCPKRAEIIQGDGGRFARGESLDGIILSAEMAKALRGELSGDAALLAPDKDGALSAENAHIIGTMQLTMPGEKKLGLAPLALVQRMLKMQGRATELAVRVDDMARVQLVAANLRAVLGPDYEVHVWEDIATFFKDMMYRQNFILTLVATVFMILMLLGVANTMLMSVLDRTREIGTMMAVGVRRSKILALFLMEAATIGALGGIFGGILGTLITAWMFEHTITITLPTSTVPYVIRPFVTPNYLIEVILIAGIGGLVFAAYPAWRASRLRPVQALAGG